VLLAVYNVPHQSAIKKKNVKIRCLCDLKVTANFDGRTLTEPQLSQSKREQERESKRRREEGEEGTQN